MRDMSLYGRRFTRSAKPDKLPTAVIADVDGTLCDTSSVVHHVLNRPKDLNAFHAESAHCPPHPEALEWVTRHFLKGRTILVVSGRMQRWRELTHDWLTRHLTVPFEGPFLRADGDYRPDDEVKREIFHRLSDRYRIVAAIDDRPRVCDLWRELGLDLTVMPGWSDEGER